MELESRKFLHDISESINSIESYTGNINDFNKYLQNKMLRRAVERELEVIGEARSRLLKLNPNIPISSSKQIISMRNRVIHGYDKIDDGIVWGSIQRHLPILKKEVQTLLK